jgi:ribonuclease T2
MAHLQIARDGLHNLWSRLAVALPAVQPSPFPAMPTALPSLRSVAKFALGGAQLALFPKDNAVLGGAPLACTNPVLSCHNTTSIANTCCFNSPGGQLLQTQFWDTSPSTGPSNSWTIHGLWYVTAPPDRPPASPSNVPRPDHCDGTFSASCDASRAYTNISAIISAAGQTALLGYMNTYWKNADGTDESFWEHEWAKHGTCISTLEPSCFTNYQPQEEVVDFFNRTVELFKTLDSYSVGSLSAFVLGCSPACASFSQPQASFPLPAQRTPRPRSWPLSKPHEE